MSTRAVSTFEITAWEESPYDEPDTGPKLSRVSVRKNFQGDLIGESTAELLTCQDEAGGAAYTALERVTGRIAERSGSFVVQHGAIRGGDMTRALGQVVPGSGTGELRGLRGEAEYRHDQNGATFTLTYDFDE